MGEHDLAGGIPTVSWRRVSWATALLGLVPVPFHRQVGCLVSEALADAVLILAGLTLLFALVGREPRRPYSIVIAAIAVYLNMSMVH
mgnify:CR=1 FL=1